jgi:hypothetical protein
LTPGQPSKISVYLHTPDASESVNTLCRAFHHDAVLIGTAYLSREVAREETVAVHIAVTNAGVSKTMQSFVWRGQPHRLVFDLHVPWESPSGPAPGRRGPPRPHRLPPVPLGAEELGRLAGRAFRAGVCRLLAPASFPTRSVTADRFVPGSG